MITLIDYCTIGDLKLIGNRLGQVRARCAQRKVAPVGYKDACKGCSVSRCSSLIELENGNAIIRYGGVALVERQCVRDEREDDDACCKDAPAPQVRTLQLPAHNEAQRPDHKRVGKDKPQDDERPWERIRFDHVEDTGSCEELARSAGIAFNSAGDEHLIAKGTKQNSGPEFVESLPIIKTGIAHIDGYVADHSPTRMRLDEQGNGASH